MGFIPHTTGLQQIAAGLHILDFKHTVEIARSTTHKNRVRSAHQTHVHQGQHLARLGVAHRTLDLDILCLHRGHRGDHHQQNKNNLFHNYYILIIIFYLLTIIYYLSLFPCPCGS